MINLTPKWNSIPAKDKIIVPPSFNDNMGQYAGNLRTSPNETSVGSGDSIFKITKDGIHLGASDFASAPFSVTMAGVITATGLLVDEIHIPDETTANSFHTETDGDSYWGCNVADWASDNDNAKAFILKTGNAKFQDITLEGLVILKDLQAGSVVEGDYINALAVGKLASGTILSKQISLGVTGGSGDAYISGGAGLDYANWTADKGFILGLDDSDSDKAKFFVGDDSNDKYVKFDGAEVVSSGLVVGQRFTAGEDITVGNAVGFGNYNNSKDYSETQSDADYTYHNWVDTYADYNNNTTNYLSATSAQVGFQQTNGLDNKEMYFYFDMDSIPDYFTNIKIRLYSVSITNGSAVDTKVRHCTAQWNTVAGNPINRGNLTWNNKPAYGSTNWATLAVNSTGAYVEWDITNLVLKWKFGNLANYGLVIIADGLTPALPGQATYVNFHTINGTNQPVIRIDGLEDVGNIYKTDIANPMSIYNFKGFAHETITSGNSGVIQNLGIVSTLSGLEANKNYYIAGAAGGVDIDVNTTNSFGAQYQVGRALTATTLLIETGQKIQTGTITMQGAIYGNISTYFKPTRIEFYRTTTGSDITSHGVAYEQSKMRHETKNGIAITTDTTNIYNDGVATVKVICIGQCATLLYGGGGAPGLTLNWIAYS